MPPQLYTQVPEVTLRVTGTLILLSPDALTMIIPEYVPGDILDAFTEAVIVPGIAPLVGVTVSQGPPEVETEYERLEVLVVLTFRYWVPDVETVP